MGKKKWVILPALFLVIQLFRPDRTNPETPANLSLTEVNRPPAEVEGLLKAACLNCHSNQTVWPWYSEVAPFSWVISDDVKRGRRELNFSEWERYESGEKAHLLKEARELLEKRDMPPWGYRLVHPKARLSDSEIVALSEWAERERQKLPAAPLPAGR